MLGKGFVSSCLAKFLREAEFIAYPIAAHLVPLALCHIRFEHKPSQHI